MKNILKIALVAMISTCNADPVSDRTIGILTGLINNNRKMVESNVTEALYNATKEVKMDDIKAHAKTKNLKNVKLEGFVLYGVPVPAFEAGTHKVDFLVSMHEGSLNYNIVHVKDHNNEATSPSLTGYVKEQVPSEGYFVLTDEAKNKISENGNANSAYKPGFGITPLRAEAFKSALSHPTVQFDKAKFLKESQLTEKDMKESTSDTLAQIKAATELKQDTDHLNFDLNASLISDANLVNGLDTLIDSFVQNIAQHVKPGDGKKEPEIRAILTREVNENLEIKNNAFLTRAFNESYSIFLKYVKSNGPTIHSDYSIELLKAKCKNLISHDLATLTIANNTHMNNDEKSALRSTIANINIKMSKIHRNMLNMESEDHQNTEYNHNKIITELGEIKSIINSISNILVKNSLMNLVTKYEEKLIQFDSSDEVGNEIYLNESFYSINGSDKTTQLRLLNLSRYNKTAIDVLNHDMVFPSIIPGGEVLMETSELLNDALAMNKLFRMSLYNSQIGIALSNNAESKALVSFLRDSKENMLFSERLKNILKTQSTTQNAINELTPEDYTQLYSAVYVKSDYEHMKKFANLQDYLRNRQTQP